MRTGLAIVAFSVVAFAQPTTFEIASVTVSPRFVGPDYNNPPYDLTIAVDWQERDLAPTGRQAT